MTANYIECYDCGAYGPDADSGDWNARADAALAAAEARFAELEAEYTATIEASARQAKTITDQQKRIASLENALEPFAREADGFLPDARDDFTPVFGGHFTIGDLRRAAALLKEKD
jgi:hypothetical protein